MKKLFCTAFALLLILLSGKTAFAADRNHVIKSWHTEAVYNANNSINIVETVTVDYTRPSHGFFRAIPYKVTIEKDIVNELKNKYSEESKLNKKAGEENIVENQSAQEKDLKNYSYRLKINNFKVSGSPFETSVEDNVVVLKIGDEDETVTGLVDYEISYTIDVGDDRISSYDEIFFTVLGADNAATVENFSFNITFEKPLPQDAQTQLFSGMYGSVGSDGIEYRISDTAISGYTTRPFDTGEAVTIYSRLPEGYFQNERIVSPVFLYIIIAICSLMLLYIIISRLLSVRSNPVVTVEFTAPDGISSAEVGYILDSNSDDKDILSLIIWFASKGHLTIKGEENNTTLIKGNPLPNNAPKYMKTFYNALFKNRTELELDNANAKLYEKIQKAKTELSSEFENQRALFSAKSVVFSFLLPSIAAILGTVGMIIATDFIYVQALISAFICFFLILISGVIGGITALRWSFGSMGFKAAAIIGRLVPLAFGLGLSLIVSLFSVTGFAFAPTFLFTICAAIAFFAPSLTYPTKYNIEITGKLLGLRNFIKMAELERLNMLIHDNPQYYYDVLPYAYVFNLTDVWAKQFETLNIPQPNWYTGSMHLNFYSMYWLTRSMDNAKQHMMQDMAAQAAKSGGAGGTSFGGGGGGFSGGGVGGGGSGSW